jgi:hypothetical protein
MEYYASFSPDDQFVAFTRAPTSGGKSSYDNPNAESWVVPSAGGTAVRLTANDPPACAGVSSPGIANSWPKWSPEPLVDSKGRTIYFIIFSSRRDSSLMDANSLMRPQLYVTAVIVDGKNVTTTGALYLWNQPEAESNHTPAWDVFEIPPPPK